MGHPRQHSLGEQLRSPYLWHRWLGLVAALFTLWIALSGLLLNHSDRLELDRRPVRTTWLLDAWRIPAPVLGQAFRVDAGLVVGADEMVLMADRTLPAGPLVGAVSSDGLTLVAAPDRLFLLDAGGELVESLVPPASPVTVVGTLDGRFALEAGGTAWLADADLLGWAPHEQVPHPAPTVTLDPAEAARVLLEVRAARLSWERVLLDLHAGRVPGAWSRWLLDLLALALIALALTGVHIHLKRRRPRPERVD